MFNGFEQLFIDFIDYSGDYTWVYNLKRIIVEKIIFMFRSLQNLEKFIKQGYFSDIIEKLRLFANVIDYFEMKLYQLLFIF